MPPAEKVRGILILVAHDPAFAVDAPARGARDTMLGRDPDDAVGRLRAVKRRGRGAFHHFDVRDVFRIDVVDARRGLTARADRERVVAGFDSHAVDVVHRLVRQRETGLPANTDAGSSADGATRL